MHLSSSKQPSQVERASTVDASTARDTRDTILQNEPNIHVSAAEGRCPPGFITRRMLRERTGLTDSELRALEARGRLRRAKTNREGWALYRESIVSELMGNAPRMPGDARAPSAVAYDGVQAASVFTLLARGKKLVEIVIELQIQPELLEVIVQKYQKLEGVVYLTKSSLDRIAQLCAVNFPLDSEDAIFDVVETAVKEQRCMRCTKRPGKLCVGCARRDASRSAATATNADDAASDQDPG